jgi:chromosome partitioning protein
MAQILSILNQKGGVGKTTCAVNLAAGLAIAGQKTLLIDIDSQGNATTGLGVKKSTITASVFDVLMGNAEPIDSIMKTDIENLHLMPATLELANAAVELANIPERELVLKKRLAVINNEYDFIIIDTPPSLNTISVNCLAASTGVIIPVQCEFYSLEGLAQLEHTIKLIKRSLNPKLEITGILLVMVGLRAKLFGDVVRTVRRQYGEKVFKTDIPRTVRFAEAPSFGETIFTFDPRGKGARAFKELTKEVIERCHQNGAAV